MNQTYTVTVDEEGNLFWYNSQGQLLHRTDGPAIEGADGHREWWLNGQYHRTDGPAVEWANGHREWWLNGKRLTEEEHRARTRPKDTCAGRVVEIDGRKYRLTAL